MVDLEMTVDCNSWSGAITISVAAPGQHVSTDVSGKTGVLASFGDCDDWWSWGRNSFDLLLPKGSNIRAVWDEYLLRPGRSDASHIVRIRAGRDPTPLTWLWEAMIGHLSRPDGFAEWYCLGRHPGPIDLVRTVKPTSDHRCNSGSPHDAQWRSAIIRVDSDDLIVRSVVMLQAFLRGSALSQQNVFAGVSVPSFDGTNEVEVAQALVNGRANLVEIIAHSDERDPTKLSTRSGPQPWSRLLNLIGQVTSLRAVVLTWCGSDMSDKNGRSAVVDLCAAGVPAVIAWHPKPQLYSLAPFHRGFYASLLSGDHIARAASLGRTAIFNALNHGDSSKWPNASGPRLYVRFDVDPTLLRPTAVRSSGPRS